jgi:hypothetical protein
MATILNKQAWEKLIDEDIDWLNKQDRTLEREHIQDCLLWLRINKPTREEGSGESASPQEGQLQGCYPRSYLRTKEMSKKLAKREKDNIYPPLSSLNQSEQTFTLAVRKLLGKGCGLSFTQTGDEIRAVFTVPGKIFYGAGKSLNEALGTAILNYYLADSRGSK